MCVCGGGGGGVGCRLMDGDGQEAGGCKVNDKERNC